MSVSEMTMAELYELAMAAEMSPGDYYRAFIEPKLNAKD